MQLARVWVQDKIDQCLVKLFGVMIQMALLLLQVPNSSSLRIMALLSGFLSFYFLCPTSCF